MQERMSAELALTVSLEWVSMSAAESIAEL